MYASSTGFDCTGLSGITTNVYNGLTQLSASSTPIGYDSGTTSLIIYSTTPAEIGAYNLDLVAHLTMDTSETVTLSFVFNIIAGTATEEEADPAEVEDFDLEIPIPEAPALNLPPNFIDETVTLYIPAGYTGLTFNLPVATDPEGEDLEYYFADVS
jgi:hypothetical protein